MTEHNLTPAEQELYHAEVGALRDGAIEFAAESPWPVHPEYTAIAVSYVGREPLAADIVLPRVTGRMRSTGKYTVYNESDAFALPDTELGRVSRPNLFYPGGKESSYAMAAHGLRGYVPQEDIDDAAAQADPLRYTVRVLTSILRRVREKRVATVVTTPANYPAANKHTFAKDADRWDASTSDPAEDLLSAIDSMWVMPTHLVLSNNVWLKLRQQTNFVKAIRGQQGDKGILTRMEVAEKLELQEVVVAGAREASSNPGQNLTVGRTWGKNALLFAQHDASMGMEAQPAFGVTPTYGGGIEVLTSYAEDVGMGSHGVIVREKRAELMVSNRAGYLFPGAIK